MSPTPNTPTAPKSAEKKSERMEVRLGYAEKQAFVEACDVQGDTPSGAVRRFISGYTRRADGELMGEANRRLLRRYGMGVAAAFIGVAGLGGAAFWATNVEPSRFMTPSAFAALDLDGDGSLMGEELGPRADDLLRVLDINGTPGVQIEEAISQGRMAYMVGGPVEMVMTETGAELDWGEDRPPARLVEFDLTSLHKAAVFESVAEDYSMKPERTVVWEDGKAVPFLVFGNADVALR